MNFLHFRPAPSRRLRNKSLLWVPFLKRSSSVCCRRRHCLWRRPFCCSVETMRALMKLLLLCVASCSWSLLIISLSLSTSHQPSRHMETLREPPTGEEAIESNPCLVCKSYKGPSKAFVRNFHRPLKHILSSVNKLDLPLSPNDLRIHLAILRVVLTQLLNVSVTYDPGQSNCTKGNSCPQDSETKPAISVVATKRRFTSLACSDHYLGTLAGYPRYKRGFVIRNCTSSRLKDVVTVVMWNVDKNEDLFTYWTNIDVAIFVISNSSVNAGGLHVNFVALEGDIGRIIKSTLKNISTPYVLLTPNLHSLKDDINLNRLIYVSERTGAGAVGGSIRAEEDGRWRTGCQLYKDSEGQLAFKRAYAASDFECQLCNFAEGPVLVKISWLVKSNWPPDSVPTEMLMPYLFFLLNEGIKSYSYPVLVCPDVMFRYQTITPPWDAEFTKSTFVETKYKLQSLWDPIARTRHLTKIFLPSGMKLLYPCHYIRDPYANQYDGLKEINTTSKTATGLRACMESELKYILSTITHICDKIKLLCAVDENFVTALLEYGDPLLFYQKFEKIPIGVEAAGSIEDFSKFWEILQQQKIYGISKENLFILYRGYFWRIRITPDSRYDLSHYKRVQVLENFWMDAHFTPEVFYRPSMPNATTLKPNLTGSVALEIENQIPGPGRRRGPLRVVSTTFRDDSQEWEFYTSKQCT